MKCEQVQRDYWIDHNGRHWPVVRSRHALKFKNPSHAALRAFVFHRDGFQCVRCGARAVDVPEHYSGRYTLRTNTFDGKGWQDVLIVDHILTRPAGGLNQVSNLQTLCEVCNKKKQKEDKANIAIAKLNEQAGNGVE